MEAENQFDPNDIPNMIALLSELYSTRRQPDVNQNSKINEFWMRYMGKAMDDCQKASSTHWQVARPQADVAFHTKIVEVQGETPAHVTQFIVATTAAFVSNLEQFNQFRTNSQNAILDEYEDNEQYIAIFNKLAFNGSQELARGTRTLVRGLWIGCRLSKAHFQEHQEQLVPTFH